MGSVRHFTRLVRVSRIRAIIPADASSVAP